jgi:hypothetical protein
MLEAGRILGGFSAVLLVAAVAAWLKLFRGPRLQTLDGRTPDSVKGEFASQLLLVAVGLSGAAALLAIVGWIAG